jgi:transcriptional regulator with GAF, ATPase, and Fis domain
MHDRDSNNLFLQIGRQLLAESDPESMLRAAVDIMVEMAGAERGLIILFERDSRPLFQVARNLEKADLTDPAFEVSQSLIEKVKQSGAPVCLRNALADPNIGRRDSVQRLKILSVICLPLKQDERVFGVVYLDNRTVQGIFLPETGTFMSELAEFISLAAYRTLEHSQLCKLAQSLEGELRTRYQFDSIIGSHPQMLDLLRIVSQIADTQATILINGESGTGKELIARALHYNSRRSNKPFVAVNCGALPETLLESELFGHVKGAFTGAIKERAGLFERADGGTLFLDEVSDMSTALQVKLLRVLQTGEFSRVGGSTVQHCDVRIVAASCTSLGDLVNQGKFREDVYYRLNVIDLHLPALRDRRSDIPLLIHYFMQKLGEEHEKPDLKLTAAAQRCLYNYDYPGNVRELENILQRVIVLAEGDSIDVHHFPDSVRNKSEQSSAPDRKMRFREAKRLVVEDFERSYLSGQLHASNGNISIAAREAGMDLKNFYSKMRQYGINPHDFK